MNIIYVLIGIFIILGIILIFQALGMFKKHDIKRSNPYNSKNAPSTVEENINVLNGNFDETVKSSAVIALINSSYFYVQTQANTGNNYDDNAQSHKFEQLLSESAIEDLKHLEGKNGQYSF